MLWACTRLVHMINRGLISRPSWLEDPNLNLNFSNANGCCKEAAALH